MLDSPRLADVSPTARTHYSQTKQQLAINFPGVRGSQIRILPPRSPRWDLGTGPLNPWEP